MRRTLLPLLILAALGACEGEPENIQAKADNLSRELENKAHVLEAEAANTVNAAVAPLDSEANALLGQTANATDDSGNAAENAAR